MGGTGSLIQVLWTPFFIVLLIVTGAIAHALLTALAPHSLTTVGLVNLVRGAIFALAWALFLSVVNSLGNFFSALETFYLASFAVLVGSVIIGAPVAVLLVAVKRYLIVWFVLTSMAILVLFIMVISGTTESVAHYGILRTVKAIPDIFLYAAPALLAFAVGARIPWQRTQK